MFLRYQESTLFRDLIGEYIQNTKNNDEDEPEEVECDEEFYPIHKILRNIVAPALENFRVIGDLLNDCEMPLYLVHKLFGEYKADIDGILVELLVIENVLDIKNSNLAKDTFDKIGQFLKMS